MHPFWKGFIPGLAVGVAVALLVSPGRGRENRDFIRRRLAVALEAGREAARAEEARLRARYRRATSPSSSREQA